MANVSKYCYDDGVLINKLDIHDRDKLSDFEMERSAVRISELKYAMEMFGGNLHIDIFNNCFKVENYLAIHKYIFQDVYPFAGKIRKENINKSNRPYFDNVTPFSNCNFIYTNLDYYFKEMRENYKRINSREMLLKYISYYYGEINMIHPFREGNGRTLRTYIEILVNYLNKKLSIPDMEIRYSLWNDEDRERLLKATIICNITGKSDEIMKCFDKVLVFKEEKKKSK